MAERVIREGAAREGKVAADIGPDDARCLLEAWLDGDRPRAARARADRLPAVRRLLPRRPLPPRPPHPRPAPAGGGRGRRRQAVARGDYPGAFNGFFEALVPALPYAPSTAFLGAEKAKLSSREGERRRVALIADGIGSMHGVTHTIEQIRERGVPGFEVDVIGTDPGVDRRLPAATELEVPFYDGDEAGRARAYRTWSRPWPKAATTSSTSPRPGPAGIAATLLSRVTGVPLLASYHTELAAYAGLRSGDGGLEAIARIALGAFYGAPRVVLSPSPAADSSLIALGAEPARIGRWERGVDTARFDPGEGRSRRLPGRAEGPLRRPADPREGRRPAGRELPPRPRLRPPPAPAAGRGRPGGGGAAGAARRARDLPRLARGRGAGPRLRQRRRLPLRQQHRHLRPGDPRGRGQRAAGRRRRRGRPGGAGREPPHRPALPSRPRPSGGRAAAARLLAAAAPPARRRRASTPPAIAPGSARWASSRPATGGRWSAAPAAAPAAARPGRLRRRGSRRCLSTMDRSTIPLSTSTASSPGSTSTSGFSNWRRTPRCRCWSGCASAGSTPPTSTSSSWSGSPASSTSSTPGSTPAAPTGSPPSEQIDAIQARVLELDHRLHACFGGVLRPALEEEGIRIVSLETASEEERREIDARFHEQVFPALTPLVIGLGRPFPYISNLSLSLGVLLRDPESGVEIIARVKVPKELLGRFLPVGEDGKSFVPLEEAIAANLDLLFPGTDVDRPRLLPGHPRRRLHRQRRGRRPPAGGPGRDPPPPLRRGRAAGDRRRDEPEAARAADRRAAARRPRGLRRRRPDRPRRPQRHRRRRPATPSCATRPGRR